MSRPANQHTFDTPQARFWDKVDKTQTCWLWDGSLSRGYGHFFFEGRTHPAHRISYEWAKGPIPEGFTLDHLCRIRSCVRPGHLEAVTMKVNILRGESPSAIAARKTHCPKDHPYSGDNVILQSDGFRRCRQCKLAYDRARGPRGPR